MGIQTYEGQEATTFLPGRSELHLKRKLWHILTGLSILTLYYLNPEIQISFWIKSTFILGTSVLVIDLIRIKWSRFNDLVIKLFRHFLRESEKSSVSGLPFYALGCSASLLFFEERIAILSILFLVFSDPISSAIGIIYGNHKLINGKSAEGFLAGLLTCNLITFFYLLNYHDPHIKILYFSIVAGIIGAFSELCSFIVDDNLSIPILSGIGLTVLNQFIQIF